MVFVNEWISPEDIKQYELHKDYEETRNPQRFVGGVYSNLKINEGLKSNEWTIDREREAYLRWGGIGRADDGDGGCSYFILNWKGSRLYFVISTVETQEINRELKIAYYQRNLVRDFIPLELEVKKVEILNLLKDALTVYGEMGMHSRYTYQLTFGF